MGWIIQALRDTIDTPEAYHRLHQSEGIPSTSASDPIGSERAGSSKPQSVDLAVSWLDPKAKPTNAPVPFSEPGSSSEIASSHLNLFSLESDVEMLPLATGSKTPDYLTSAKFSHLWSLEAAHPETMTSTTSVSEQGTHLQQSFPSGHDVATEEQLEGGSSANSLPMDVGLEINPSQSIAARPSGSLTLHDCSICAKTFSSVRDLAHHSRVHNSSQSTAARPSGSLTLHNCSSCTKSFRRPADLRRHSLQHNPKALVLFCPVASCSRSSGGNGFSRQDKLRDHMRNKHSRT